METSDKWCSKGVVAGTGLFSISVGAMDSGIDCIVSKIFDTKLSGGVMCRRERMPARGTWTVWRGGPVQTLWYPARPSARSVPGLEQSQTEIQAGWKMDWLRTALRKSILVCWWIRNSTWPSNARSKPRKTTVFWAASKEMWPAGHLLKGAALKANDV